jgi:hypothetical protein
MRGARRLQAVEVYQMLYYKSKIKAAFEESLGCNVLSSGQRLVELKKFAAVMYAREMTEVVAVVEAKLSELSANLDHSRKEEAQDYRSTERTPEQYHR